jgi:uncharacterized protein with GYD domain
MPKYLIQANGTMEGWKGVLQEGGVSRRAVIENLIQSMGGTLEAFYYAFGETDEYVIADLPDNVTMASILMTVAASGSVTTKTNVLITPEEVDQAMKKTPLYRPPGK